MSNKTKIYVNLPVKNLQRSIDFFSKLGFTFNPQFTDENSTCMVITEDINVMLLVDKFFKTFTNKAITDTSKNTEVITAIFVESREKVDELVNKAFAAGAKKYNEPYDHGWMYGSSFQDPDEHLWEIFYMDINAMPKKIE